MHMFWSTAVAVIILQHRLGVNYKAPPDTSRQRNLAFHRPKHLSTVFLVFTCAFWYLLCAAVETSSGLKGVNKYGWMPYPRSPSSQPFFPAPSSRCTWSTLVLNTAESWTDPCHLHKNLVKDKCASHTALVLITWKPLWQTYRCSSTQGALMGIKEPSIAPNFRHASHFVEVSHCFL